LATPEEFEKAYGERPDEVEEEIENYVCDECGTVGEVRLIPEHDDCDLER
jgi:hypothetical protein